MKRDTAERVDALRLHLIEHHGISAAYFAQPHMQDVTLENLRWLHAPYLKTSEYPQGCDRRSVEAPNRSSSPSLDEREVGE